MRHPHTRRFEADDLLSFKLVAEMVLSPDGRWIVYVLEEIDAEADTYVSNLWLIPASGGAPRQITFGSDTNESPRFSPDASRVAFLSDRDGGPAQLYVIRIDGGEARRLTDLKSGAGLPAWSPDGAALVERPRSGRGLTATRGGEAIVVRNCGPLGALVLMLGGRRAGYREGGGFNEGRRRAACLREDLCR